MYERFTDRARKIMEIASQESVKANHRHWSTEHVLLGLLKQKENTACEALQSLDISIERLEEFLRRSIGLDGSIPTTPHVETEKETERIVTAIRFARDESKAMGHTYVGSEHLLLGLIREGKGVAGMILGSRKITLTRTREAITKILQAREAGAVNQTNREVLSDPDFLVALQQLKEAIGNPDMPALLAIQIATEHVKAHTRSEQTERELSPT